MDFEISAERSYLSKDYSLEGPSPTVRVTYLTPYVHIGPFEMGPPMSAVLGQNLPGTLHA